MTDERRPAAPLWLRLIGSAVLALMGAGVLYALVIAIRRFPEIGV